MSVHTAHEGSCKVSYSDHNGEWKEAHFHASQLEIAVESNPTEPNPYTPMKEDD
jgi:hypothetical protein